MRSWEQACHVLCQIWTRPITTKSDKAREWADVLAWATQRGYVSTEVAPYTMEYGNLYKVTHNGLLFIRECFTGLDRDAILGIVDGKFDQEDEGQPWEVRLD